MPNKSGLCTCGHVHGEGTRCRVLVSGTSLQTAGPTYCACDAWHDVNAGPVPPLPPPVA